MAQHNLQRVRVIKGQIENIDFVVCHICGEKSKRISGSHVVRVHDTTLDEYRNKFPEACVISQKSFELKSFKSRTVKRKKYKSWSKKSKSSHKRRMIAFFKTDRGKDSCKRGALSRALTMDDANKKRSESLLNFYDSNEGKTVRKRFSIYRLGKKLPKVSKTLRAFYSTIEGKEIAKRKAIGLKGISRTQEVKDKISKANTGHLVSKKTRLAISKTCKGRKYSSEEIAKRKNESNPKSRKSNKIFWNSLEGKKLTKKILRKRKKSGWDRKHSEAIGKFWKSEKGKKARTKINLINKTSEYKRKMKISVKKAMKNPLYWKNRQKGLKLRPNKFEQIVAKFLPDSFQYTGDFNPNGMFRFLDGKNKNADFTLFPDRTKVIECFGIYWHGKTGHIEDLDWQEHEKYTIDSYRELGVDCLIIWQDELKDLNCLKEKISNFCKILIKK